MHVEKKFKLKEWYGFDEDILDAARDFCDENDVIPNMVIFNIHTWQQINFLTSCSPKRKSMLTDDGKPDVVITQFKYTDGALQVAIGFDIDDMEFKIAYSDDKGNNDNEDNGDTKIPINKVPSKDLCVV